MPLYQHDGRNPRVDPSARVAPTATIVGDVEIGANSSIGLRRHRRGGLQCRPSRTPQRVRVHGIVHLRTRLTPDAVVPLD